jgi:hypothetical protein
VGKPNSCWKKEDNTTILLLFDVGISSPEHFPVRKEMILNQLLDFALIYSGFLLHFRMGSGHGARGKNPERGFNKL